MQCPECHSTIPPGEVLDRDTDWRIAQLPSGATEATRSEIIYCNVCDVSHFITVTRDDRGREFASTQPFEQGRVA